MKQKSSKILVVFDLVSTLTDAGPRYAEAFSRVCSEYGVTPPEPESILKDLGNKNLKQITENYAPHLSDNQKSEFMDACNTCCDTLLVDVSWHEGLFKNVRPAMQALHDAGYVLGIYTGTREDATEEQLRYHNIAKFFDQNFIRAKNNERDGFVDSHILKENQLKDIVSEFQNEFSGDVIVIGDSISDYKAAKAQNLPFIGFAPTEKKVLMFKTAGVQNLFSEYLDLPRFILNLNNRAEIKASNSNIKPSL
jgi:phosphoglycolate phosphatase-like HAD superfamily hydrolase